MNPFPDHLPNELRSDGSLEQTPAEAAHAVLKQFDCPTSSSAVPSPSISKPEVRQALSTVKDRSDYQIFGVCAESLDRGLAALHDYAHALGYTVPEQPLEINGPVYIKFNTKSRLLYADSYQGDNRGVLVSCQSAYESGINEMYGPLPLDLYR
ncbi:MAG: DUF1824 family protein [Synechococcales bacterium]|nr:DUF1824 family protein [Synechococcales bacterium]